jgi:predicted dehydrogenase
VAEVKRMALDGELGRVVNFYNLRMGTAGAFLALSWGREKRTLGGLVRTLNCHEIDVLRWIAGEITHVRAEMARLMVEEIDYEDIAWMTFTFEGGALGLIGQNIVNYLGNHYYEIMGTEATVRFRTGGPITVAARGKKVEERPTSDKVAVHEQARCFLDSVEAGRIVEPMADGMEAVQGLAVIDAAYRSAETGAKERVAW